jgi:hypothetical protein
MWTSRASLSSSQRPRLAHSSGLQVTRREALLVTLFLEVKALTESGTSRAPIFAVQFVKFLDSIPSHSSSPFLTMMPAKTMPLWTTKWCTIIFGQ